MATIKQLFESEFRHRQDTITRSVDVATPAGSLDVKASIHDDFVAGVRFVSLWIPQSPHASEVVLQLLSDIPGLWNRMAADFIFAVEHSAGEATRLGVELPFSGQIYVYTETELDESTRSLVRMLSPRFVVRGPRYAAEKTQSLRPACFISHDARDAELVAKPLATHLSGLLLAPVWYDEFSLQVGDSLRASIDKGLKEAHRCVVVLSKHYIRNERWARAEFDSIFTRHVREGRSTILPVRVDVSDDDVFGFCALLGDIAASHWSDGVERVASRLAAALQKGQ